MDLPAVFVSSNTPWFFNGLRIQWFPTNKLKIEPWIINGWQSYAKYNGQPGLGGQILWRPREWFPFVFNNYGMGKDTLVNPSVSRIHTDDSIVIRGTSTDRIVPVSRKLPCSFTGDLGCEYGGGVCCLRPRRTGSDTPLAAGRSTTGLVEQEQHAITIGGGQMDNPSRYLTLLPPIDGANALTGSPYFTENLGEPFRCGMARITYQ